jgi:uncharacterized membrane protein
VGDVNSRKEERSGPVIALLTCQWLRLVRMTLPLNSSVVIRNMLPLVLRVLFLLFTVIYFFSVIGYYRFCGAFDDEKAADVDDWADRWVPYHQQLNFNTMLQTTYTLFEVAVLGNWSFVMRAAMLSGFASALLFFYAYRLAMTLIIIPILTSFIIQVYNARSARHAASERDEVMRRDAENQKNKAEAEAAAKAAGICAIEHTTHDLSRVQEEESGNSGTDVLSEVSRGSTAQRRLTVTRGESILCLMPSLILPLYYVSPLQLIP